MSGALFPKMLPPREQGWFILHSDPAGPSTLRLLGEFHHDGVAVYGPVHAVLWRNDADLSPSRSPNLFDSKA